MPYVNPNVYDNGLAWAVTNGTTLSICSAEPANYAGIAAVELGVKADVEVGAPEAGAVSGRRVIIPEVTGGTTEETGDASHWALHDDTGVLVAAGPLTAAQTVTTGNPWSLAAISIEIENVVLAEA